MPLKLKQRPDSPNWYIVGTVRGIAINESTGIDIANRAAAEDALVLRNSELLKQSIFGKSATVTFFEAAVSYMSSGGSNRFIGNEKPNGQWTGLIGHFGMKKKLLDISQGDLDRAALTLYPNGSPETRNRQAYTPFVAVYNHAVANGWGPEKKWKRPKRPKGTKFKRLPKRAGTTAIDYDTAYQFVKEMSPAAGLVMTCLFFSLMRPIELLSLNTDEDDIRPDDRWIVLSGSKTGHPRGVPMHDFLVPIFRKLKERGGHLFRDRRGNPYTDISQLRTSIVNARRRSGVKMVSAYTARHSSSSQLVLNDIHKMVKDEIMGHAVTEMSEVYTHIPQQHLIDAVNTIKVPEAWKEIYWIKDPLAKRRYFVRYHHKNPRKKAG